MPSIIIFLFLKLKLSIFAWGLIYATLFIVKHTSEISKPDNIGKN